MFDVVRAQTDLYQLLLSCPALRTVNIVLQRKMQLQSEIKYSTIINTPRNGCGGAGILVEMPTASCESKNVDGPVLDWRFPILVLEHPALNFAQPTPQWPAKGTAITAEEILQIAINWLHNHADELYGTFQVDRDAVKPAPEVGSLVSYRSPLFLPKGKTVPATRCGVLQLSQAGGQVTIACPQDPDAEIRYTIDGTLPGSGDSGNSASQVYGGPFQADSGVTVRALAFKDGKNPSSCRFLLIP